VPSLTVKDTVYLPAEVKVCVGLCNVLVLPSPKSQDHEEALPVDLSMNVIAVPIEAPVVDAEKSATGEGTVIVIVFDLVSVSDPPALVAVRATV
jgi:hypothetical protein